MAVEIGALRALLSLDSAAFEKGAKRAQASMNGLQRRMTKLSGNMRKFGRTMSTRVTAPLTLVAGAAVRSSLKTVDAQAKMAESLDTSVVSIQNLTRASDLAGISQEDLDGSLRRMTRRISLAEDGTGAAVDAFERLNLSASDLADLPVDERVELITGRIREMIPEAEQAGVASKVFGDKTGLAIMRLDGDVIARATEEVRKFGVGVSDVDADKIEAANDAMSAIGLVTRGLANQLTVALAPVLKTVAERIAEVAGWFSNLSPEMKRFVGIAAVVAAAIGPLAIALGFVAAGMAALASPIGLAILGFGAVAGAAAYVATQWDELIEKFPALGEAAERVGDVMSAVWEGIKGVVKGAADIVSGAINTIVGVLTGDLKRAVEGLSGMWQGWVDATNAAVTAVLDSIAAIVPGAVEALTGLKQVFVDKFDEIMDWLREIPSRMKEIGSDMIQGMIDGIKSRTPNLGAGAAAAGRGAENAARRELETQSPSRVFMRIGQDLMDGLGLGIEGRAQSAANSAAAAAQRVTDAASSFEPDLSNIATAFDDIEHRSERWASGLAGHFDGLITGGKKFGDVLMGIARQLESSAWQQLFSGLGGGLFGGGGGGKKGLLGLGGFLGFLDGGGNIGAGQFAIAGERGPEIVTGPARVTSRVDTARMMRGGGGRQDVNINVNVHGANGDQHVMDLVQQGVSLGLREYDRNVLPESFSRVAGDQRMRG